MRYICSMFAKIIIVLLIVHWWLRGFSLKAFTWEIIVLNLSNMKIICRHVRKITSRIYSFNNKVGYYTSDVNMTQPVIKFNRKAKFEDKNFIKVRLVQNAWIVRSPECLGVFVQGQHLRKCIHVFSSPTAVAVTRAADYDFGQNWTAVITAKSFSVSKTSLS